MSDFAPVERAYMARAVEIAERGRYGAHPNPMVGCVIVAVGGIVGEGWHASVGEAHAEINALTDAGDRAAGATVFCTLEPCPHQGRTPPCTAALIAAGVAEVVVGMEDPNPQVAGQGLAALADAGIRVRCGLLADEVAALVRGFAKRMRIGRPLVRLKIAASLDGCVAMADGQSQWITGPESRADVHRLRAAAGAILTGIGTVLADDPALTVRDAESALTRRQPLRAVLDNRLRMPMSAEMLALPGQTVVYFAQGPDSGDLLAAGAEVVRVGSSNGYLDIGDVLDDLGGREVNDVLVEAGPALSGSLVDGGFVDELVIYQAPHIMGSETIGMFRTPTWTALADRRELTIVDVRPVGNDTRITAHLAH